MLISLGLLLALEGIWPVTLVSGGSFLAYLSLNRKRLVRLRPLGGYANWITLSRLALLIAAGSLQTNWHPYWSFLAFLLVIVTDGIDGYLARRYQQQSEIGATLDIETDALLCFVLAAIHYQSGFAGGWILLAGSLRYLYVLALPLFRLEKVEAPAAPYARLIGVLFVSGLLAPFVLPEWLAFSTLALGCALVAGSFALSFGLKYRAGNLQKRARLK